MEGGYPMNNLNLNTTQQNEVRPDMHGPGQGYHQYYQDQSGHHHYHHHYYHHHYYTPHHLGQWQYNL
jgi:hypothetical protein